MLPTDDVFSKKHKMESTVLLARVRAIESIARLPIAIGCDIGFDAENGFDSRSFRLRIKLMRAEEVAVIGHRDRIHPERFHAREQSIDLVSTIEQRVLAMQVQVREHRRWWRFRSGRHCLMVRRGAICANGLRAVFDADIFAT